MKHAPIGDVFEMIQLIIDQLTEPGMTRKRFKTLTTLGHVWPMFKSRDVFKHCGLVTMNYVEIN